MNKILFLFLIPVFLTLQLNAIEEPFSHFPRTVEEIETFKKNALSELENARKNYQTQAATHRNFDHAVTGWHRLVEALFLKKIILTYYSLTTSEKSLLEKAQVEVVELDEALSKLCSDEEALKVILTYAKQVVEKPLVENLSPIQIYQLNKLLETAVKGWPSDHQLRKNALELQIQLSQQNMLPFAYAKGELASKELPKDKKMTVLTWNVCCFNQGLSMFFGGILPWQDRISRLANALQNSEADIICLQEVFSPQVGELLCQMLKKNYAHFYFNVGPKIYGFDIEALGVPSGLFVASKYPLNNPVFHSYNAEQTPKIRGYGFFSAEIQDQNRTLARLIATHLQPNYSLEDRQFRQAQMQAILNSIGDKMPTFVCGDLNIERSSDEYDQVLKPYFLNQYNGSDWTCCELKDYWWKADEDVNQFHALGLPTEWLDYFLCLKNQNYDSIKSINTDIFLANDPLNPKEALSDHQGILTSITFKE